MEGINQDGNSERAGNGAIVGSGISQNKTTEKKKQKNRKGNLYCESHSEVLVIFAYQ